MKPNLIMYCSLEICLLVREAVLIFILEMVLSYTVPENNLTVEYFHMLMSSVLF